MPRKNVLWLTGRPELTIVVYRGCYATTQNIDKCGITSIKNVSPQLKLRDFSMAIQ